MASAKFTRDEVILALDALYSSKNERLYAESEEMAELSALLNRLPIHPIENRREDFRTPTGIAAQLYRFQRALMTGVNKNNVGLLFFDINCEFYNRHIELHNIALAIRRNEEYFAIDYGNHLEDYGFPEGILLGHLHRIIEMRDGAKFDHKEYCEVCSIKPELYYKPCGSLLQSHLLTAPAELDGKKKYGTECFITVCPTCHAVLHRLRPWRTRDNCGEILN